MIFVTGTILTFVSFAFAPQSVLAPLESVQFVSNVFFTKLILGRKITRQQVLGTCLIILGCITAITFHIALGEGHSCGDQDGDRRLSAGEECTESPGPHNVPY